MRGTEKSVPKGNADLGQLKQHVHPLFRYVYGRGEGPRGSDFHQMLPETASRSRRNPLIALLGNPGLQVCPRTGSSVQGQGLCLLPHCQGERPYTVRSRLHINRLPALNALIRSWN